MNSFNSVSIHTQYVAGLWNECILIRFVWQCMDDINSFSARIQELGVHGPNSWLPWLMMLWLLLVFGTHHTSYWLTLSYRLWHGFLFFPWVDSYFQHLGWLHHLCLYYKVVTMETILFECWEQVWTTPEISMWWNSKNNQYEYMPPFKTNCGLMLPYGSVMAPHCC